MTRPSIIPWHVFREALESQDAENLEYWLDRWGFTNDGVVLIMRSESQISLIGAQQTEPYVSALSRRPSLQELVQILIRDPAVDVELAKLWPYKAL